VILSTWSPDQLEPVVARLEDRIKEVHRSRRP
jgi:hypothetical protein